jgi:hypothetical protein
MLIEFFNPLKVLVKLNGSHIYAITHQEDLHPIAINDPIQPMKLAELVGLLENGSLLINVAHDTVQLTRHVMLHTERFDILIHATLVEINSTEVGFWLIWAHPCVKFEHKLHVERLQALPKLCRLYRSADRHSCQSLICVKAKIPDVFLLPYRLCQLRQFEFFPDAFNFQLQLIKRLICSPLVDVDKAVELFFNLL